MQGSYSSSLVALSIVVAIVVAYTALKLTSRLASGPVHGRRIWLGAGAFAMGVGIWSMHFIGMLAWSSPVRLTYDLGITFASLGVAILTSGFALAIAARRDLSMLRLSASALVMGAGIASMHYSGMGAIRLVPALTYEPLLLASSIAIAIGASFAALWLAFKLRSGNSWKLSLARFSAAVIMGFAIAGMHYTGMAASRFGPGAYCTGGVALDNGLVPIVIGLFSLAVLAVALVTALFDAHLQTRNLAHMQSLQKANAQLQHQALHDALTGLPNRVLLEDRLGRALAQAERDGTMVAVACLDLDRFKAVNDSLGHSAGDELLREVSRRLLGAVRAEDTVGRMGGDEFALVLPGIRERGEVEALAATLLRELGAPYRMRGTEVHTSPSIGVSFFPGDGREPEVLLARSDEAMYYAKQCGRNNFQLFSPHMSVFTHARLELENDLRFAVERHELELHYQPKIDVETGRVKGAEALLRWRHPRRGVVSPGTFIPLAEESGLIHSIGEWVLQQACRQARRWQLAGMPSLRVAVNLSPKQFRQRNLLSIVKTALHQAQLPPHLLELELTESCVMTDSEESAAILQALSELGVLISIDDFGTGYSSMSYLRRFPVDKLKIDRSFVKDLGSNAEAASIVQAIISLAHGLRLKVIAEGVETEQQLAMLRELGCDQYQGYLFSPPVEAGNFEGIVFGREDGMVVDMMRTYSRLSAFRSRRNGGG